MLPVLHATQPDEYVVRITKQSPCGVGVGWHVPNFPTQHPPVPSQLYSCGSRSQMPLEFNVQSVGHNGTVMVVVGQQYAFVHEFIHCKLDIHAPCPPTDAQHNKTVNIILFIFNPTQKVQKTVVWIQHFFSVFSFDKGGQTSQNTLKMERRKERTVCFRHVILCKKSHIYAGFLYLYSAFISHNFYTNFSGTSFVITFNARRKIVVSGLRW